MNMSRWAVAALLLAACGGDDGPRSDKPTAPGANDEAYTITGAHEWSVVNTAATTVDQNMNIFVEAPAGTEYVDGWVADLPPKRFAKQPDGRFGAGFLLDEVPIGEHQILLSANDSTTAFAALPLKRTAPYYVLVTTDWDFADPGSSSLIMQDELHADHPELRMTHFIGPYTFTDPTVTPERKQELVTWVQKQRDMFEDEIGLHIHPYCNFVTAAGLTCITDQSTTMATDATGYTIKLGAYNREQTGTLFAYSKTLFEQNGLGTPKTFRAGGWTATLDTIAALADQGFIADTSALNWARIEEWDGYELYRWNMEAWNPVNDTSQPYYPSESNVLTDSAPTLPILEVPDNGVMIDYVSLNEMKGLFDTNWNGTEVITTPRTLMMGFHPAPGFTGAEYQRVNDFLSYADMKLASRRRGPVVYITLHDLVADFK